MQQMIDGITNGNYRIAFVWISVMAIVFLIGDLPSAIFRKINNKMIRNVESHLYQEYIGKYVIGDNNKFESLGTGRINNIISRGISSQSNLLQDLPNDLMKLVVAIIGGFVIIAFNLSLEGFLIFIGIFAVSFVFIQYANKQLAFLRKERRDVYTEQDRNTTRLIMSKFEVLQNNKFPYEKSKISSFYEMLFGLWKKESTKMIMTYDLQKVIFTILRIGVVYYVVSNISNGVFTIGDLALLWLVINIIYGSIMELNNYIM